MRRLLYWVVCVPLLVGPGSADEPKGDQPAGAAAGKPMLVLESGGHTAAVRKVLFTPDARQLISVGQDKAIRFWDVNTGQMLRVLRPPAGPGAWGDLRAGALSPDGTTLAVAGWGIVEGPNKKYAGVHLITLATGAMRTLRGHSDTVNALAFSRDGKLLASGGQDKTVRVWEIASGECLCTLEGHRDTVYALAFSPTGEQLVSASNDGTGRIWSLESGKAEAVLRGAHALYAAAWSPDGKVIVTGGRDSEGVRVWSPDGRLRRTLPVVRDVAEHLPIALGVGVLLLPPETKTMVVYDLMFRADAGSTGSKDVVVTWRDDVIKGQRYLFGTTFVDYATGERRPGMQVQQGTTATWMYTAVNQLGATAGGDEHGIWLWGTFGGEVGQRLVGAGRPVYSAGWSTDGAAVAWGVPRLPGDATPPLQTIFRFADLKLANKKEGLNKDEAAPFRGARTTLGSLSAEVAGRTLQVKEGDKVLAAVELNTPVTTYTFLDGDRIAVASENHVWLYEARAGKQTFRCLSHRGDVHALVPSPDGKYLLSASEDQTVRITPTVQAVRPHSNERAMPLLSLFAVGNEWIAWTEEGYYAASAGGERLMGWQTGGGPNALATFYPAAQFRASLYRPDVIGRLLQEGDLGKALAAADLEKGKAESKVEEVAEVLPPEATLTAPGLKGDKVGEPGTLEVVATATGKGRYPVTSLQLILDGRPYTGGAGLVKTPGTKPGATVTARWKVQLPLGDHTLRVLARSQKSTGFSNDLEVTYSVPPPKPNLYVLAVGIDAYDDKNLKLHCAENDAGELVATFEARSKDLFEVKKKLLLSKDKKATRAGILKGLEWLKDNMKANPKAQDVAVVFYAGHGEVEGKSFYLLPQDVKLADLAKTGLSGEELRQHLADLPGRVVLLLDACHSGRIGNVISDMARDLSDEDCGVVVVCAALGSERAGEADGHGFFCRALMEVLSGERPMAKVPPPRNPRDGLVYLHHVEQYVIDRVQDLSHDEQHPTAAQPALRPLALSRP
jgi:WD40 repeat protein